MSNISNLFADQKTRMIVVLTGILLISMIVWGFFRFTENTESQSSSSSVSSVPNIESVPDPNQQLSPTMTQNIKASDQQRIDTAKQSGQSALPTLLPQSQGAQQVPFASNNSNSGDKANAGKDATKAKQDSLTSSQLSALNNELTKSQQDLADAQARLSQQQLQAQQKALQDAEKQQKQLSQNMQNQAQALFSSWSGKDGTPTQAYVEGKLAKDKDAAAEGTGQQAPAAEQDGQQAPPTASTSSDDKSPAAIKAGDVMFGILRTEVNSDQPGPILATLVSGKYRGAKLVGSVQQSKKITGTNGPETVVLTFNTMSVKGLPNSVSINAIAIDPDTARTALASDVDHHRLYRYGTLFASSFLSGYGNAISSSGSVTFSASDGTQTSFQQQLNPTETFLAALGEVGTELGDSMSDAIDRPNTIVVNSGISLGLLFLDDVTIDEMAG